MDLQNKLAVVTGAANGIGKAISIQCAMNGCKVALVDINENELNALRFNLKSLFPWPDHDIHSFICDVSKELNIKNLVKDIQSKFNTLSIQLLFNNVGVSSLNTSIINGNMNNLQKVMNTNIWSIIYGIRQFLPLLLNNNASTQCYIVNTGSLASIYSADSFYGVTKHTVLAISETVQKEIIDLFKLNNTTNKNKNGEKLKCNILVSTLCPGGVNTNFFKTSADAMNNIDYNDLDKDMKETDFNKKQYPINSGMPTWFLFQSTAINPNHVAKCLFDGLKHKKTIIHTDINMVKACIKDRDKSILNGTINDNKEMYKMLANIINSKL